MRWPTWVVEAPSSQTKKEAKRETKRRKRISSKHLDSPQIDYSILIESNERPNEFLREIKFSAARPWLSFRAFLFFAEFLIFLSFSFLNLAHSSGFNVVNTVEHLLLCEFYRQKMNASLNIEYRCLPLRVHVTASDPHHRHRRHHHQQRCHHFCTVSKSKSNKP